MSEPSLPAPDGQHKPDFVVIKPAHPCYREIMGKEEIWIPIVGNMRVVLSEDSALRKPPAKPKRRRPPRKSGLYAVLHAAQQFGITPPSEGFWVMLPKEYQAIDALEHKDISQVVLEILMQTIGSFEYGEDGRPKHKEWAALSYRHFARAGLMTSKAAQRGIKGALEKGYIVRRQIGAQRFEYAIRWRGTN